MANHTFFCIDGHTCGNPVRVVAGGAPALSGETMIEKRTRGPFGDRKQELVFIGTKDMDEAAICAELDGMLVKLPPDGKVDTKQWARLPDPFPEWRRGEG